MLSSNMRPNAIPKPPGVQGSCPDRSQHQPNHPDGASGLQDEFGPEAKSLPDVEKQPKYARMARHEVTLVPAGKIAAGVVLEQRIAIPQRRREQGHKAHQRGREIGCAGSSLLA